EADLSTRRALVLALGEYMPDQVPRLDRDAAVRWLLNAYRDNPDPGLHSAIDWLLRRRWGRGEALTVIDRERAGRAPGPRRWLVDRQGDTMVLLGPDEVVRGSPPNEPKREPDPIEKQWRVRIPRTFAIATREVTVAQFTEFRAAHPKAANRVREIPDWTPS